MRTWIDRAHPVLLVALGLLLVPATAAALQCRTPAYQPGSSVPSGGSGTDSCHCGIFIHRHHLTCETEVVYTPPHYTCDGPASESVDCVVAIILPVELRQQKCSLELANLQIQVRGASISITFPVCTGTFCEQTDSRNISYVLSGVQVPC